MESIQTSQINSHLVFSTQISEPTTFRICQSPDLKFIPESTIRICEICGEKQ